MRVGLLTTAIFGDLSGMATSSETSEIRPAILYDDMPSWPVTDCKINDL